MGRLIDDLPDPTREKFLITTRTESLCTRCGLLTIRTQPRRDRETIHHVTLPMQEHEPHDLQGMLDVTVGATETTKRCISCEDDPGTEGGTHHVRTSISAPEILVVHIKRPAFDGGIATRRNDIVNGLASCSINSEMYALTAVVAHRSAAQVRNQHYTTYVVQRSPTGAQGPDYYTVYDDSVVRSNAHHIFDRVTVPTILMFEKHSGPQVGTEPPTFPCLTAVTASPSDENDHTARGGRALQRRMRKLFKRLAYEWGSDNEEETMLAVGSGILKSATPKGPRQQPQRRTNDAEQRGKRRRRE